MKLRLSLLCAALALLTVPLFAGGSSESASASKPASGSLAGTTIVFQTFLQPGGSDTRGTAWGQIIDAFTKKTGINVKTSILPWQQIDPQLILSTQSGNPPDVSFVRDKAFAQDVQANALEPLDSYIQKDFTDATQKDFLFWDQVGLANGHRYALRMHYIPEALYIRKDLLKKTGLPAPQTWDDFVKVGQALSKQGVIGYLFAGSSAQPAQLDFLQPMIEGRGGHVLSSDGQAAFQQQAGIDTYQFLKSLVFKYGVTPSSATTTKYNDVDDAFKAGQVGMIIEGVHLYGTFAKALGADKIELARIPGVTAGHPSPTDVSGWNLGIPRGSKHADAAWQFIKFSTGDAAQLIYTKVGGQLPVRKSLLDNPYFKSPEGAVAAWALKYMRDAGQLAVAPKTYQQLNEDVAVALQKVLSDPNSNVTAILDQAAKQYDATVAAQ